MSDSIVAPATPTGISALAVIRVSGPQVQGLIPDIFGETPPPRMARHADYRNVRGQIVDDVLFTCFIAPHSFTGEDTVEISCHGNPFIVQQIIEDLLARGFRAAQAGEFSQRSYLNGRMDLSQAEAVMDLIHARSERALMAANQQLRGSLGRQMESLISRLINCLSIIEAYIDFPDEDLPRENHEELLRDLETLKQDTNRLLATSHYGVMLRDGIRTLLLGEPNAGKSSLLNRLVGRDRALVSAEPGTTRDYLEERIVVGAHSLRLIDTAGLNATPTQLEQQGIDKTLEQAAETDLYLWVIDGTRSLPPLPTSISSRMSPTNTIAVINKTDLEVVPQGPLPQPFPVVRTSALTGLGLEDLQAGITRLADLHQIDTGSEVIAINARHAHALETAKNCLEAAIINLRQESPSELIASDLRGTLAAYGEISGKIDNEQVLDRLFASFCIGK